MANSIIGAGFSDWVYNQILKRQKVNRRTSNKTIDEIRYQNNNTAFLRLTSAIDIDGDSNYARAYQLFNTQFTPTTDGSGVRELATGISLNSNSNTAYGWRSTSTFGFIPPPGLISADVKSQNRGSLKEANINIVCHNKDQFEIISKLYLRIGYSMLLEWGWSYFFHNDEPLDANDTRVGKLRENYSDLDQDFLNGTLWGKEITIDSVLQKINLLRKDTCGNYDAVFGRVVNYSWSLEKDGSYNITLTLKTWGDIIESLKGNVSHNVKINVSSNSSNTKDQPPLLYNQVKSSINRILWYFTSCFDNANAYDYSKNSWFTDPERVSKGTGLTPSQDNKEYSDNDLMSFTFPELNGIKLSGNYSAFKNEYYVRLGAFLRTLQNFVLLYNTANSNTKKPALVEIDYEHDNNFMFTYPRQGSTDPRVCLIPLNNTISTPTSNNNYNVTEKSYRWKTVEVKVDDAFFLDSSEALAYDESTTDYANIDSYVGPNLEFLKNTSANRDKINTFLQDNLNGKLINISTSTTTSNTKTIPVYNNGETSDMNTGGFFWLNFYTNTINDLEDFQDNYVNASNKGYISSFTAQEGKEYLIKWGELVETVSETVTSDESVKIVPVTVTIRTYEAKTWMLTNPNTVYASNNNISPTPGSNAPEVFNNTFEKLKDVKFRVPNYDYIGHTMDIMVNMNFIAKVLEGGIDPKTNSISIFSILDQIMSGIQSSLGSVNNFNTIYNEDTNQIKIIDSTFIPGLDKYKPELFKDRKKGLFATYTLDNEEGSFLRNASIKSKMSPAFATVTAIGAQSRGNIVGENATSLSLWNEGLTDRVIREKATEMQPSSSVAIQDAYSSNLSILTNLYNKINDGNITDEDIDGAKNTSVDLFKYEIGTFVEAKKMPPLGFLPIDLELVMDGLSGVKIYETYTADDRLLPKEYNNKIEFITIGVSHKIQNNDWTTTLNSITSPTYNNSPAVNPNLGNVFQVTSSVAPPVTPLPTVNLPLIPSVSPASNRQKDLVKKAIDASFSKGELKGKCARGTYNHAVNLTRLQKNQNANLGMNIQAGGNANNSDYWNKLVALGYTQYNVGNDLTRPQLLDTINNGFEGPNGNRQPWVEGDIVVYWSNDGDPKGSYRQFGHTQMYIGDINKSKWTTDNVNNYNTGFVYKSVAANNWNLLIFKAPTIS